MAIRANLLFGSIFLLSVLFLLLYKPFGLIDRRNTEKIPAMELYNSKTFQMDQTIHTRIRSEKALQYTDVIEFNHFEQYKLEKNQLNILQAKRANYYDQDYAEFFDSVNYKQGDAQELSGTYAYYDMKNGMVSSNKRFHLISTEYDMYGSAFTYDVQKQNFKADNIELEVLQ
jgi:hypothetical protein